MRIPARNTLLFATLAVLTAANSPASTTTVIRDVRLFDGAAITERATVVIQDGVIGQVITGADPVAVPKGAELVEGAGHTLLPGLIDAHTHTYARAMLERSLDFGVTTCIEMGTLPDTLRQLKAEQTAGPVPDRADMISAGMGVTVPGGHGTQFGFEVPTLGPGEDEAAFVAARIEEGSEFIKLVMDDFSVVGFDLPTLSAEQVGAVVEAAHQAGLMAVVHARDPEAYLAATLAGVDGFAHGLSESLPDRALLRAMRERKPFVIPTLTTTEGTQGGEGGTRFAADPRIGPLLTEREKTSLRRKRFEQPRVEFDFTIALGSAGAFNANGTLVLAGTDYPNPGTTPGASMHRELELLVEAGLSPVQALKAATANAAVAFKLTDRGRITPGLRADLLLVAGDPTRSITDTRNIAGIWKDGLRHPLTPRVREDPAQDR